MVGVGAGGAADRDRRSAAALSGTAVWQAGGGARGGLAGLHRRSTCYVFLLSASRWNDPASSRAARTGLCWNHRTSGSTGSAGFIWSSLIYWMIAGALQAYRYYERYMSSELQLERMEKSYSQARLNALRMQLDPHFLFNALNTISSHVERDPKLTRLMIEHLGDLLRMSLESKDRQEVPLAEELAFLDHYLAIQKIRFGGRLKVEIASRSGGAVCLGAVACFCSRWWRTRSGTGFRGALQEARWAVSAEAGE